MFVKDQIVFTLPQKSQWVDVVEAAQREEPAKCRKSFERYVRKYPKLVGFGLLYGHLVVEEALLNTHPYIVSDPFVLTRVAAAVSARAVNISPLLDPARVEAILRVSLGLDEHQPSDSNEMLLVLIVAAMVLPEGRASIVSALGGMEEKVRETFA